MRKNNEKAGNQEKIEEKNEENKPNIIITNDEFLI